MPIPSSAEKCLAFVSAHVQPPTKGGPRPKDFGQRPLITISRETGSGGVTLGEALARHLDSKSPKGAVPWTVFDKNLVQTILEDHELPSRIAEFMPEDRAPGIEDAVGEILGLHPSAWRLIQQTTETVLRLAEMGNVVLVGRGSTIITQHLPKAFHIRVIASLATRIDRIRKLHGLSRKAAIEFIHRSERARHRYLKKYFKRDIGDPLLYDLIVNTDRLSIEEAARIVGDALLVRSA